MPIFMSRIPDSGFLSGFFKKCISYLEITCYKEFPGSNFVRDPVLPGNGHFSMFFLHQYIIIYKSVSYECFSASFNFPGSWNPVLFSESQFFKNQSICYGALGHLRKYIFLPCFGSLRISIACSPFRLV